MKNKSSPFKKFSITTIWLWLSIFALVPTVMVLTASFLTFDPNKLVKFSFTLKNYADLFNSAYLGILIRSIYLAGSCTIICLIIGYPFAFLIARTQSKHRSLLLLLVIIPFWTSSLIRTYAIMAILKTKGILNTILLAIGIIDQPLQLLYTNAAVLIGSVYDLLPFMILPLYTNIEKLNHEYLEAAKDLGANWFTVFFKVIIPLTKSGIIAGSLLVFLPAMTMFYIPALLGGARSLLLGNLVEYQFLTANNWPLGTAISVVISMLMIGFVLIYWYNSKEKDRENLA